MQALSEKEIRCLVLLRVKVVVSNDGDVEACCQGQSELCGTFRF